MKIVSFSYKQQDPPRRFRVFDCRDLPNPHRIPQLAGLTGKHIAVQDFVLCTHDARRLIDQALHAWATTGHDIAFGCFGGKHRSVALAEHLATLLAPLRKDITVEHLALKAMADAD
jgi:UPF0042 nucleotide-binding protein